MIKILNVINLLSLDSYTSLLIYYELYKSRIKIIQLKSPEVAVENKSYRYGDIKKLRNFFIFFLRTLRDLLNFLNPKLFRAALFLKMDELIILYSGNKKILPHLKGKKNKVFKRTLK